MRLRLVGLCVAFGLSLFATSTARAQDTGFSDPFFLYYSYFLPRQNALAAQPQPEDFFRNQSFQRQAAAQNDRAGLYDNGSYLGQDELDPMKPYGRQGGSSRSVRTVATGLPSTVSKKGHSAPGQSFQRHNAYFPTIRSGMGSGARGGSGGGLAGGRGGMPGMGASGTSANVPNATSGMGFR